MKRVAGWIVLAGVMLLAVVQILPFGRDHANPSVRKEPQWDTPETRELAVRACFDCHSNQTRYPWYSYVAPASWLVNKDIDEARSKMNFSEWDLIQREAMAAPEEIEKGNMPLPVYLPLHPEAWLSAEEKAELIHGIEATFAADRPRRR